MPRGQYDGIADNARRASHFPRPNRAIGATIKEAERERKPGETLEEAVLRLQIAKADTEELDKQRRQIEIDKIRGDLVTKEQAKEVAEEVLHAAIREAEKMPSMIRAALASNRDLVNHLDTICGEVERQIGNWQDRVSQG
jgi:predicted RNase H-like HicB family nuclease